MAQMHRLHKSSETSRSPGAQTSPTFEQLLQVDSPRRFGSISPRLERHHGSISPRFERFHGSISPRLERHHDHDEDNHHNKKSVLTIVKEKAKKLRHSLSGKKKHGHESHEDHEDNTTPLRGFSLEYEEKDDDDPEYLGAPMYESELAPENYKEAAKQHPRSVSIVPEHNFNQEKDKPTSPNKGITQTISDATHTIASKIAGLTVSDPNELETKNHAGLTTAPSAALDAGDSVGPVGNNLERCSETRENSTNSPQRWDKGISVKEYFLQKVEPGEDERALSQVISEAISPRKSPREMGMMGKMKEAVTSFLWPEEPSHSMTTSSSSSSHIESSSSSTIPNRSLQNSSFTTNTDSPSQIPISNTSNSPPLIPISTNAQEAIEEQNHGRILQAN